MRRLLPLLLLAPALLALAPPKPKLSRVAATFAVAPDSSITASATAYLSGALQAPDSIRWTVYRSDSLQTATVTKATQQVFAIGAPAYEQTATYKVCARVFRGTSASGNFQCASWTYTRPAPPLPPPPVVDSITVAPKTVSLEPGATQQFCAFPCFTATGHCALRAVEAGKAVCVAEYAKLASTIRAVTPAEQAAADAVCVQWSATGGTITAEACATGLRQA